jgi:glycosyltransferase involved in cell wall biosynthesis
VVLAITRALVNRGDSVWVVCLDDSSAERFRAVGATIVRSRLWFHPINPLDAVPFAQLHALCLRERFDLVATHTSKGGFLGRLAARLAGTPHIIHHAHGFAFRECNRPAVRRFYIELERLASRCCDSIISVSEDHRQGAIREQVAHAGKIHTILNGIDLCPFEDADEAAARRQLGFRKEDVLLCVASRLAPKKGLEYLIAAMPAVAGQFPSIHLVLFGEGPMHKALRRQAERLGISDRVHFPGFRPDIPKLLAAFDVILQPSLSEGLSISILEAMAAARPIIACNIQGNREIIRHCETGLLVPPADSAALSEAIAKILSDPVGAKTMGQNAALDCRTRFSQERMVEQTVAIYDSICRRASSPPILRGKVSRNRKFLSKAVSDSTPISEETTLNTR